MRPAIRTCGFVLAAALLDAVPTGDACAEEKRVPVRVTSASGNSVYLDQGRSSGIQPGDTVLLFPVGDAVVKVVVQSVSRNNARCVLPVPAVPIAPGTQGVALTREEVGIDSENSQIDGLPRRPVPEHPPWTQPLLGWDDEQPLLAPARPLETEERPQEIHGRVFTDFTHTWDLKYLRNQYSLARLGTNLWVQNPLGKGGTFHLDVQANARYAIVVDAENDANYTGNPSRISYSIGGDEDHGYRFEAGRFLQYEFPEFGFLDGVEYDYRIAPNHVVGVAVGAMPEPFPDFQSGKDLQTSVFYRGTFGDEDQLTARIGYQKTWHEGIADRDLVVAAVDYVPTSRFSVNGTVWGDFYGPSDTLESQSFEVTQAILQSNFQFAPGHGVGVHLTDILWPDLLRNEIQPYFASQVPANRVLRYGVYTWQQVRDDVRINASIDHWVDQSNEGTAWDTSVAFRDLLYDRGEVAVGAYGTDGLFNTGPGGRISLSRYFSRGFAIVSYDISNLLFVGHPDVSLLHGVHASVNLNVTPTVNLTFTGDARFGSTQGGYGLGAYLQKRF